MRGACNATAAIPAQMTSMLDELRDEAIGRTLPALFAVSAALLVATACYQDPAKIAVLFLAVFYLAVGVWVLRGESRLAATWLLVAGSASVILLAAHTMALDGAITLLALPVGLAALITSVRSGILAAAACTILLGCAPPSLIRATGDLRLIAGIGLWGTVGLIWLTTRHLLTMMQWSWSSYQQSRSLLEQARDQRLQLKQALADLADANLQLTRVNRLTDGLRQAAEDARRAKEQFVANVSHELRTPLNMVIGFCEMIIQAPESYGGRIPPALLADLKVVLRNSQHLASLIDDVLDLSQVEAGRMALTKERVQIGEIIEAAVTAVRPLFASKRLYLEYEICDDPAILCDRTRIREVLLNLLSNAGRFTERGGVRLVCRQEMGSVVISVTDTGPGISPADQERLFVPYEQLDGSVRRKHGGTGLGLAISKRFVEMHGGRIWLESKEGMGTTFSFCLPIDPPATIGAGPARWLNPEWEYRDLGRRRQAPAWPDRRKALVVETGNSLQRLLARYLGSLEVCSADTIDAAARDLVQQPAQTLVLNAISIGEALAQLDRASLPEGTTAILTAIPDAATAAETLGVAGYLVKPISCQALLATLDGLSLNGKTVLIVDDQAEAQRLFRRMLVSAGRGYRVLRASDGQEALALLHQARPDVVLLDLTMPGMDGFRLLEAKAADPAVRDIPVIVVSARDPTGQPIASNGLAISRVGGLSVSQVLAAIDVLIPILESTWGAGDPVHREASAG
ncbi:MAG: ATP-binding protein [Anaerolineae bacterium]